MEKNDVYYFHQTPELLCRELIKYVDLEEGDKVLEAFRGEGSFYNCFPDFVEKDWTEITEGRDYKDYTGEIDWVITNPPFQLDEKQTGRRENTFFKLLKYYSHRAKKGIAFLGNDTCFSTLTPNRLKELNQAGWYIHNIIVCNVKKWRGRYFFMIFKKSPSAFYNHVVGNF